MTSSSSSSAAERLLTANFLSSGTDLGVGRQFNRRSIERKEVDVISNDGCRWMKVRAKFEVRMRQEGDILECLKIDSSPSKLVSDFAFRYDVLLLGYKFCRNSLLLIKLTIHMLFPQ